MTTIGNKHVLITGGASGMGRRLAARCAGFGATVSIWDLDGDGAADAAAEAAELGAGHVRSYTCDVGDHEQVRERAAETVAEQGEVDILVNNAGIVCGRPLMELTPEHIERTFRVNTLALFWTTQAFLPAMVARGSGHVVNVASAAGLIGSPRLTDYTASKFAAVGFNEALRLELKRSAPGVKTSVICPYYIDTGMFEGVKTRFPLLLPILKEADVVERIVRAIQHDRPMAVMPWVVGTVPAMRMLPVWAFDRAADFLGLTVAMDEFTGRAPTQT